MQIQAESSLSSSASSVQRPRRSNQSCTSAANVLRAALPPCRLTDPRSRLLAISARCVTTLERPAASRGFREDWRLLANVQTDPRPNESSVIRIPRAARGAAKRASSEQLLPHEREQGDSLTLARAGALRLQSVDGSAGPRHRSLPMRPPKPKLRARRARLDRRVRRGVAHPRRAPKPTSLRGKLFLE